MQNPRMSTIIGLRPTSAALAWAAENGKQKELGDAIVRLWALKKRGGTGDEGVGKRAYKHAVKALFAMVA